MQQLFLIMFLLSLSRILYLLFSFLFSSSSIWGGGRVLYIENWRGTACTAKASSVVCFFKDGNSVDAPPGHEIVDN